MTAERRRTMPPLPQRLERVYLIGICGTAMGSLAAMLQDGLGCTLLGSDSGAYPPMSDFLADRGIDILPGWNGDNLRGLENPPDLVVVGNVCRRDNPEVLAAIELGLPCLSLPEVLRALFLSRKPARWVITGTHGKTTTSSIAAWFAESSGLAPSFMIGGIVANFGGNYKLDEGPVFIIEGDEYDTAYFDKVPKFWHYEGTDVVIGNIEFDHADIYPDLEAIVHVFRRLVAEVPEKGRIWANLDDPVVAEVVAEARAEVVGFGLGEGCALRATAITTRPEGGVSFEVWRDGERLGRMESPLIGEHNVRNTLAALGLAMSHGARFEQLVEALPEFRSVRKRQEWIGEVSGVVVFDDFAHHPTAVRETVRAFRSRFPEARMWGIFEAKSNTSRRAVFQDDYPEALSDCDLVVLSKPWRKDTLPPEQLIDLDQVVRDLEARGVEAHLIPEVDDIVSFVAERAKPGDVVLGMSGSSFGGLHGKLLEALARD